MSRAFVKDQEADYLDDLPDRTVSKHPNDVTDAGLAQIGNLKTVSGLNLTGTSVTDAGLASLKPLSRLTKLNLTKTAVTDEGAAQAKKFLPFWATITRDKP